ncbi:MAG TPA: GH32 C-terminal domain-containing protein [Terriglobales bacterium]|nr:GH32 C-terminal domain-containing protein [Terriglobales bacterium]
MRPSRREFLKALGVTGAAAAVPPFSRFALSNLASNDQVSRAQLAADPLRPQFHLLPARNWMNDPDGPIYWKGAYHMFFQYNPNAAVWGDMHWAHSVSPDMIHWRHLPMALSPTPGSDDQEGCFTGSAVNDDGTATILYTGVKSVLPGDATLRDGAHNFREVQCLASSQDSNLLEWQKLPAPVLTPPSDPNLTGFRDPCLWRDGGVWYMGIGSGQKGVGGRVLLYRSYDLRQWEYLHPLASGKWNGMDSVNPVDSGEMWECPDFFPLGEKHVLLYSTEGKVFWETGELDPKELVFHAEKRGLLDCGAYYAPKSQLDFRDRRILWGWIPETRPEAEYRAAGWAGCMSLPRELALGPEGELVMRVVPEVSDLGRNLAILPDRVVAREARRAALRRMSVENLSAEIRFRSLPRPLRIILSDGHSPFLTIVYSPEEAGKELEINGKHAQLTGRKDAELEFHIFLDGSVVETIANDRIALTSRVYAVPRGPLHLVASDLDLDSVVSLQVSKMQPISPDRLTT